MRHRAAFLAIACLAALPVAAASPESVGMSVKHALRGGGDRFVEAPAGRGFVANAATRSMSFGATGVEVRPRGAQALGAKRVAATLRYEFASAAKVAPAGVNANGITYNWFIGAPENWATNLRGYSQIRYAQLWPGIDATYSGDTSTIKYHFDVAPGADPRSIRFTVSGASEARVTEAGVLEWTVGGALVTDDAPVAFQGAKVIASSFRLERIDAQSWSLAIDVADYDPSKALVVDPAWIAVAGLVGGNASDQVNAVAADSGGSAFACGSTASTNLPPLAAYDTTANGGDDAFIVKLNASGSVGSVTYFGGNGYDVCTGIAVDSTGIYVTGGTTSTNFPFMGADPAGFLRRTKATSDRDAFVSKFNVAGTALVYSGVFGGASDDQGNAIALDGAGRAHLTGYTQSTGFPVVSGGGAALNGTMDAFVARVKPDGTGFGYAGFIGGNGDVEVGRGIVVGADGSAYIAGETNSATGLPATAGTVRTVPNGGSDGFVAKVLTTGAVSWLTLLTGTSASSSGLDRALAIALDPGDGTLLVAGETDSANFPANDAGARQGSGPQNALAGSMDGFLVRMPTTGASILAATYLGGARFDSAEGVAADNFGNTHVTGTTSAESPSTFPTKATAGLPTARLGAQDGFLAAFGPQSPLAFVHSGFIGSNLGGAFTNDAMHAITARGARGAVTIGGATGAIATGFTNGNGTALGPSGAVNGVLLRLAAYRATFDMNGDGKSDLVWQNTDGRAAIWLMNGRNSTASSDIIGPATGWSIVQVADFNGDGKFDLVWQHTDGRIAIYLMNGITPLSTQQILNAGGGWSVIHAPDLNGDGKADLVFQNTDGRVAVWTMNGTTMTAGATIIGAGTGWSVIKTGDFDGDGSEDLLWRHADGRHAIWLMTGATIKSTAQILNAGGWTAQHATDLDGDGKADIVWQHSDGTLAAWLMNGAAMTAGTSLLGAGSGWSITRTGDFDGDGKADLFFLHADGRSAIWTMNGLVATTMQPLLGAGSGWSARRLVDLDGDGRADIAWQNVDGRVALSGTQGDTLTNLVTILGPATGWSVSGVSQ